MTTLDLITAATAEAHEKHGHDFEESSLADRMLIVGEEFGEINRAIMDARAVQDELAALLAAGTRTGDAVDHARAVIRAARRHILHEVAQLTSLGFRWLETDGAK